MRSVFPSSKLSSPVDSLWSEACEVDLEARQKMHAFLYTGLYSSVASLLESGVQSIAFDLDNRPSPRSVIVCTDSEHGMESHNVMAATLCERQDQSRAADVYLCVQTKRDTQQALTIDAYHSRDGVDFELHRPREMPETPGTTNWSMWRWRQPRLGMSKLVITPRDSTRRVNYVACAVRCVHESTLCTAEATRASALEILMPARASHRDPWILNEVSVYAVVDGEERLLQPLGITVMHGTRVVACFNAFSIFNPGFHGLKQFPTGASLCAQDN